MMITICNNFSQVEEMLICLVFNNNTDNNDTIQVGTTTAVTLVVQRSWTNPGATRTIQLYQKRWDEKTMRRHKDDFKIFSERLNVLQFIA